MAQLSWEKGFIQRASRRSYQEGELIDALDVVPDPEGGGIATRLGDTLATTVSGGRVYSLYQTYTSTGLPVPYQAAGGTLYRNSVAIQTGLTPTPISFASLPEYGGRYTYTYFAGGQEALRHKDSGTLYSNWGLTVPSTAPAVGSSVAGGSLNGNYAWRQIYVRKPVIPGGVFGRYVQSTLSFTLDGTYPFLLSDAVGNGIVLGTPETWAAVRFVIRPPVPPATSEGGSFEYAYWNGQDWLVYATVPWGLFGAYLAEHDIPFPITAWQPRSGYYLIRIRMLVAPTTIATISDLTFYDGLYAARSNPSPPSIVTGPYGIGLSTAYVNVADPVVPPDNEIQATHVAIYRTIGDDAALAAGGLGVNYAQFFFERDVPAGTPNYASAIPDTQLGELIQLDNDRPPIFDTIAAYQNRIFGARGARLFFSKAGFAESFPGTNYLEVGSNADPIQRINQYHGSLYIWTTAAVYILVGTNELTYDTRQVQAPVGLGAINTVAEGERAIYFLGSDGHLWGMQGTIAANISRIGHQQLFEGVTLHGVPAINTLARAACVGDWGNGRYRLSYPVGTDTLPSQGLMLDEARGSWWRDSRPWQSLYYDRRSNTFYGGLMDGKVVRLQAGTTDHGAPIVGTVQTLDDMAQAPDSDKDLAQLVVESTSPNGLTITPVVSYVLASAALGTVTTTSASQVILPSPAPDTYRGLTLGYVLSGTAPWSLSLLLPHVLKFPVRSRVWQTLDTLLQWPGPKILESILLDCDLVSGTLQWQLIVDRMVAESGTLTTLGRHLTQLIHFGHEGTVFRLILQGTGLFLLYPGSVLAGRPLPPPIYDDTLVPTDLGILQDKIGLAYALDIELLSPGTVTTTFYADGNLIHTINYSSLGRQRTERFRLPSTMVGRLFEIRRVSTAPYRLWPGTELTWMIVGNSQEQHFRQVQEPYGQLQQLSLMQLPHTEEM